MKIILNNTGSQFDSFVNTQGAKPFHLCHAVTDIFPQLSGREQVAIAANKRPSKKKGEKKIVIGPSDFYVNGKQFAATIRRTKGVLDLIFNGNPPNEGFITVYARPIL